MLSLTIFALLLVSTQAIWPFDGKKVYPDWDRLSVTFPTFSDVPMKEHDAISQGWTKNADGCKDNLGYHGKRYILNGEMATMLLFDQNGKVAGIQMAMSTITDKFTLATMHKGVFLKEGDYYIVTAYFTEPSRICNGTSNVEDGYVGDKLFLVMNEGPMEIPLKEHEIGSTKWTRGRCFFGMGQHYWYNVRKDMDCMDSAPFFLLYNGGELNGFGFATFSNIQSSRVEHPDHSSISWFFQVKPDCADNQPYLTTQHVYLQRRPYLNVC